MAGASISVYEFYSMVTGQHIYKSVWTSLTDKMSKFIMLEDNKRGAYAVNDQL